MPPTSLPLSAEGKPMIGIVTGATALRGLDHLVVGVRDLDAAAASHEALGFTVGQRNRHPWGTENRIVQFPGSFLELITVPAGAVVPPHTDRQFSFGAFVKAALDRHEGISMLVLDSANAVTDAASFKASGIGDYEPFFFERQAVAADGSPVRVAFTLAFARDEVAPACGFFVCQQHEPQNFWNPQAQRHPNGSTGIASVLMSAENPADHHIFLEAFTGQRGPRSSSIGISLALTRGRVDVATPQAMAALLGEAFNAAPTPHVAQAVDMAAQFAGFSVTLPDIPAMAARLAKAGIASRSVGKRLIVPASAAFGTAIIFEPET